MSLRLQEAAAKCWSGDAVWLNLDYPAVCLPAADQTNLLLITAHFNGIHPKLWGTNVPVSHCSAWMCVYLALFPSLLCFFSVTFIILLLRTLSGEPRCGWKNELRYGIRLPLCTSATLQPYLGGSVIDQTLSRPVVCHRSRLLIEACLCAASRDHQMSATEPPSRLDVRPRALEL